jgi:chromosome segregation ATPase
MIKKALFTAGGLGLLAMVFLGRDAASYVLTSAGRVTDSVRDAVPVEFEIDRARRMVKNLVPDIRRNMHVIAKEEVEVDRLERQLALAESQREKNHSELSRLSADLSDSKSVYRYAGRTYTTGQVKADLARRLERCKTSDATLESLRGIHRARQQSLDAARQKLEGMLAAKRQLEVEVENLEARLKMVEVAQTTSDVNFDDSRLARVKELMTDLHTRLAVAEKLVNVDTQYQGEIQMDPPAPEDIVDQVTDYLRQDSPGHTPEPVEVAAADH